MIEPERCRMCQHPLLAPSEDGLHDHCRAHAADVAATNPSYCDGCGSLASYLKDGRCSWCRWDDNNRTKKGR